MDDFKSIHEVVSRRFAQLARDAYSLGLLEYVRDEAHRFAQHYHHLLRGKRAFEE